MKKLVYASVMALATLSLFSAPMLRAQDSTISIKDPAEFTAFDNACGGCASHPGQNSNTTSAPALEGFLQAYPKSVARGAALNLLIDVYQGQGDAAKTLDAATRIDQLLLARVERVTLRAELHVQVRLGAARGERVAAGAVHGRLFVLGVDVFLHDDGSLLGANPDDSRTAVGPKRNDSTEHGPG